MELIPEIVFCFICCFIYLLVTVELLFIWNYLYDLNTTVSFICNTQPKAAKENYIYQQHKLLNHCLCTKSKTIQDKGYIENGVTLYIANAYYLRGYRIVK